MSKEEKQIKEITDNDLDTGRDLVTENYQLEILTLKDKVDLRRFSRAFLKVDKLLKNIFSNKLDKGEYGGNAQDLKNEIDRKLPTRVVKSIINVNQWSSLLDINRGGTFKVIITYGRGNVVAKGIFLITLGHNDKANIITLATHDYSIANFSLRMRMKDDRGVLEMLDVANKGAIPENGLQDVYLDIFDVSDGIGFTGFTVFTPSANDGKIACFVETKHGSMYYNNHRLWHTGEFNPDDKENIIGVKYSGFNKDKTDVEQNDSNKLFTALGALNLKNWLVTNYTTLMNNIRDTLNSSINTKLSHGGYGGTGQQLKNEIDTKFPSSESWRLYGKQLSDGTDTGLLSAKEPGNYYFQPHLNPKFRVANLEVRCLNMWGDHRRQTIYNYDDLTTYVRNTGVGGDQNGGWVVELNTNTVNQHYCPYRIGDILTTTIANNPAEWWANTAWEKIEHCFLYAHNSAGSRSGENTIYLNINHLPSHNHGGDYIRRRYADGEWDWHPSTIVTSMDGYYAASDNVGGGAGINNMPAYYTVHVWKRIA